MKIDLTSLPDPGDQPTQRLPDTYASTLRTAYRQQQPNPDQYGKVKQLSSSTGIPRPVVSRNIPAIEKAQQEPDWQALESTAPKLTRAMAQNIDLFHLAKDDTENLSFWENEVRAMTDLFFDVHAGWKSGAMTDELGLLGYQMKKGHDTPEMRGRIQDLNNRLDVWRGTGGMAEYAAKFLSQAVQGLPEILTFAAGTGLAAGGAAALGGQVGPQIALPEEIVTVPAATTAGFTSGFLVKSGERAYRIEAGHAYLDMIQQDIEPDIASKVATGVGIFNAALEMGGLSAVGAPIKRALSKLFAEKATDVLVQRTAAQAAKTFAKDYATAWVAETGTEVLQEVVNVVGEEIAKQIDPKDMESLLSTEEGREQIVERLGSILEEVGKGMAILALPGATINFRADLEASYRAEENRNRILAMGDSAEASKLRERSPELFEQYVTNVVDGSPTENVYIDAEQFRSFFQSKGMDPMAVAAQIPSVQNQLEEALNTGGDLVIPLAEYANTVATTEYHQELSDYVRFRPEDMSAAEAREWQQNASQEFQQEAERVISAQEENQALIDSADKVFNTIRDDIVATGRFTDDVADAYATLHRSFAITMADRLGMQPHEIYERYGLRTRVPSPAAEPRPSPGEAPAGGTLFEQESSDFNRQFGQTGAEFYDDATNEDYDDQYSSVSELVEGVKSGRLLVHVRVPDGTNFKYGIDPSAGEFLAGTDAYQQSIEDYGEGPELTFFSDDFSYLTSSILKDIRKAENLEVVFVRKNETIQKSIGDGNVELSDGSVVGYEQSPISDYESDIYKSEPAGVEKSDWYTKETQDVVAVVDGNAIKNSLDESKTLAQEAKGSVAFAQDITSAPSIITLYESADLSTFLHESGHFFFEVMTDIGGKNPPPEITQDLQTLMNWYGIKDLKKWNKMSDDKRRQYHEKFARGFEAYLFEGKSPNLEIQGIFSRFKAWLLNIYKNVKNLNVKLTDEVRGVMDRMLATDEQIKLANAAQSYRPLFESAEQAGMTGAEWADYIRGDVSADQQAGEQLNARSLREMKWLSNAKSKIVKSLQNEAKEKRKSVRTEVAAKVEKEPVYRAIRWLRRGEMTNDKGEEIKATQGYKLDRTAVEEMYPPGALVDFDWKKSLRGMTVKREDPDTAIGLHPNLVAEMFGFSSGDHLISSISEAEPIADVIERRTDDTMLERYGDISDPVSIERAAEEAIHNDARAKFIAAEYAALARRTGKRKILIDAAKQYAAEKISEQKVRDAIKFGRYKAAERKAAVQAEKSFGKGDSQTAAVHKRAQLLNFYMYRESVFARNEVDKIVRYFRKFEKTSIRRKLGQDYVDQIDRLLEAYDFRKISDKQIRRRQSLSDWIESQREKGFDPVIDESLTGELGKQHYRDVSLNDLRGLHDAIKNIEHLGRVKNKLLSIRRKRELDAVLTEVDKTIRDNKQAVELDIETRLPQNEGSRAVNSFFASHRKFASFMRQMDGFKDGGVMWETFVKPLNDVSDNEAVMREEATKRLTELFSMFSTKEFRWMYEKRYIREIGKSLTKQARIMIALNWGNKQNRQRITESLKMSGYITDESQMNVILNTLEKRDWDFVQGIWDYINEYWPQIAEKEKNVTGLVPEKVEAEKVNTRFGDYAGGYFPIKYDNRLSPKAFADSAAEAAEQSLRGAYARDTTRRGHTKARVDKVRRPVRLDYGVIFEHVDQVIHDLAFHEYLVDTNRIMGSEKFQNAILETYGHDIYQQLKQTITDVAAGDIPAQTTFQSAINWVRSGASIAAMGWNVGTAILQPFGLTQSMVRIGPKWVGKGLSRWFRDSRSLENSVTWIHEKSKFMASRSKTMQREINEIRNRVTEQGLRRRILGPFEDSYFWLISRSQMIADIPTWLGAYEKAMDGNETEDRAVALADQAVIDSQGGGQIKDLAQIQRGGPLMKLWTNFYSYFNVTYNLTSESFAKTNFKKPESVGRLAVDLLMLYIMPATLSWLLREALIKGECQGGSDIECVGEKLVRENLGYMAGTMVGLREVSGVIQGYYGYEGPAGARAFSEVGNLMMQIQQGEVDEALLKALNNTAGVMLHYPAGQVQRTAEGIVALSEGETGNPMALFTGPPRE